MHVLRGKLNIVPQWHVPLRESHDRLATLCPCLAVGADTLRCSSNTKKKAFQIVRYASDRWNIIFLTPQIRGRPDGEKKCKDGNSYEVDHDAGMKQYE